MRSAAALEASTAIPRGVALAKKAPNPTDKHVGSRVRMRRMMLGMSQEKLGDALGLTLALTEAFMRIGDKKLRRRIVDLVEQIAGKGQARKDKR